MNTREREQSPSSMRYWLNRGGGSSLPLLATLATQTRNDSTCDKKTQSSDGLLPCVSSCIDPIVVACLSVLCRAPLTLPQGKENRNDLLKAQTSRSAMISEPVIDSGSCPPRCSHGTDNGGRSGSHISSAPDPLLARTTGGFIGHYRAPLGEFESLGR